MVDIKEEKRKKCKYCKNNFNFKSNKIFCSHSCKVKYYYHNNDNLEKRKKRLLRQKLYYKEGRTKRYLKICKNCKKKFIGVKDSIFCSHKCVFQYNRTISQNLEITKLVVLQRANGRCEKCGEKCNKFHVHHIIKAEYYKKGHSPKNGTQNNPNNLIALCIFCHRKLHSKGIKRFTNIGKCIACGKEFKFYPKSNRGKYCSRKCAYENSNLKMIPKKNICNYCGLEYMYISPISSKFCSKKCKSKWHYHNNPQYRRKEMARSLLYYHANKRTEK